MIKGSNNLIGIDNEVIVNFFPPFFPSLALGNVHVRLCTCTFLAVLSIMHIWFEDIIFSSDWVWLNFFPPFFPSLNIAYYIGSQSCASRVPVVCQSWPLQARKALQCPQRGHCVCLPCTCRVHAVATSPKRVQHARVYGVATPDTRQAQGVYTQGTIRVQSVPLAGCVLRD